MCSLTRIVHGHVVACFKVPLFSDSSKRIQCAGEALTFSNSNFEKCGPSPNVVRYRYFDSEYNETMSLSSNIS